MESGEAVRANWQWEHASGFRDYDRKTNAKIEAAYQAAATKLSVKSGKTGDQPIIIFFVDMLQLDPITGHSRRIRRASFGLEGCQCFRWVRRLALKFTRMIENAGQQATTCTEYQSSRDLSLQPAQAQDSQPIDIRGWCARVVGSNQFEAGIMVTVAVNAVYLAIAADYNEAPTLSHADLGWQVIEHLFCVIFISELVLRCGASPIKRDCLKDPWFRFDLTLVIFMVVETWLIPLYVLFEPFKDQSSSGLRNWSVLRLARLVRFARISRLARWAPAMITLLKGIAIATRAVFWTIVLLLLLLFSFGIIFKTLEDVYPSLKERQKFSSVRQAMWSLLMHGIFMDEIAPVANDILDDAGDVVSTIFFIFVGLVTFIILNMLIGFQCEVAASVTAKDEERNQVRRLRRKLLPILECYDEDDSRHLQKNEFTLLLEDPQVYEILDRHDIDVRDLLHLKDVIYEDKFERQKHASEEEHSVGVLWSSEEEPRLSFDEFIATVLRLRGSQKATVTDIVEVREHMRLRLNRLERLTFTKASIPPPIAFDSQAPAWAVNITTQIAQINEKIDRLASPAAAPAIELKCKHIGLPDEWEVPADASGEEFVRLMCLTTENFWV